MTNTIFVAWRAGGDTNGRWGPVGRLRVRDGEYEFRYTEGARILEGFKPFVAFPDLGQVYRSPELFPLFANRLLVKSRPEYPEYLAWLGFKYTDAPSPIAIFSISGGRRATDSLELFPKPEKSQDGQYSVKFFLRGIRWLDEHAQDQVAKLRDGDQLALRLDDNNEHDPYAVSVHAESANGVRVGHVPRYLARDVRALRQRSQSESDTVTVVRMNPDAPTQQRVLCEYRTPWPVDFQPCSSDEFQSVSVDTDSKLLRMG